MMSELLPAYVKRALDANRSLLPAVLNGPTRLRDAITVSANFRIAAIGALFLSGRFAPFGWRLCQSGRAFAAAIPLVEESARLTSKATPFFDAVAAGDWTTAQQIATLSRRTWAQGEEYEEDFLFVEILMQHAFLGGTQHDNVESLARYEASLAGTSDSRLPVLEALVAGEATRFEERLTEWLNERAERLDAKASRMSIAPDLLATEWHLSVEGVALVRVARHAGLPVGADFPQVPAIALAEPSPDWWRAEWRTVDSAM